MRTEFFWLLSLCGFAAVSLICGLVAGPQLAAVWPGIREKIDSFRRLPPLAKVVLLLFVGVFIVYGGTKPTQGDPPSGTNDVEIVEGGTNDVGGVEFGDGTNGVEIADGDATNAPPMMLMMAMPFSGHQPPTVTPEDIARGWQLVEVRTNCNISYAMPEGATLASNWWVRGAYEDCSIVRLGDCSIGGGVNQSNNLNNPNNQTISFPFGTNEYDSVWAFSWGKVRFALADTNTEIVAVGAPMSAVPYRSRLWSAADTNDSRLVTWENFVLNRDTNTPVNAQIELRTTGDFVTRSNEVEKVYRRVDPDDWDDDGWENGDDPDPYVGEDFSDYFYQELPEGANEAAYCWIEIRPRWNSDIWFYGDAPSNLDDPYIYGKAGVTYRVQLLIGKTYDVESTQPLEIVAKSDERIEVSNVEVKLDHFPADTDGEWEVMINDQIALDSPLYNSGEGFLCCMTSGVGRAMFNVDGAMYSTPIKVIEPQVEIRNVRANDLFSEEAKRIDPTLVNVNPVVGEAGHLLLFMDRYAEPYYVSFEGLQFIEIPDESHNCPHDQNGYYADESRGGPLSHTAQTGAGKWRTTNSQAFFGTDAAGKVGAYQQPWASGWKSWPIPMGWGYGVDVLGRFRDYPTFQTFTLDADGKFAIEKFGHRAERDTWGLVWVDDSLQLNPWPW